MQQVKEKKTHIRTPKPPFMDFSPLRSSTVRVLCLSAAIAAFGIYTPIFFMVSQNLTLHPGALFDLCFPSWLYDSAPAGSSQDKSRKSCNIMYGFENNVTIPVYHQCTTCQPSLRLVGKIHSTISNLLLPS